MQLYEQLREDIVKGVYPHGKKLPSKRLLAEESGCSVITVEHAYAILSDEGYIEPNPLPTIRSAAPRRKRRKRETVRKSLEFSIKKVYNEASFRNGEREESNELFQAESIFR